MSIDLYMNEYDPKDHTFRTAFWEWFDNLPRKDKIKFWNQTVDMSMIYFYNKYYRHDK